MSDKEPRRRKKRKDSQKKDDVRSDDQIFMSTRSESKDSDQEMEEEVPISIHQPSSFAKIVFLVLFSGLVVSMSVIFISLHGAERGAVDLFDDHHSDDHISLENYDQIDNISSLDHQEDEDHESDEPHEELEKWSTSEFIPENLLNMLPDIGNILSFNNEQVKESGSLVEDTTQSEDSKSTSEIYDTISDSSSQESLEDSIRTDEEDISPDVHEDLISRTFNPVYNVDSLQDNDEDEEQDDDDEEDDDDEPFVEPSVDQTSQQSTNDYEFTSDPSIEDTPSSISSPDITTDFNTEVYPEDSLVSNSQDDYEEELDTNTGENKFASTPDYETEDRLMYEKAFITNEEDYEIRDKLDQLDSTLEKNLPDNSDDDDEEDEDDETEDEFDFWQF